MKKLLFLLAGIVFTLGLPAQEKILDMETAVLGYNVRPASKNIFWQGERNIITYIDGHNLVAETPEKEDKNILMTLAELNGIIGEQLNTWPVFSWQNASVISIMLNRMGKYYEVDVNAKQLVKMINFSKVGRNLTYNGKDAFAYTKANNLYYSDERGNEYAVTTDNDPDIVNGQTVSRNEMGITNGIFWSPDGKKIAYYRKDESKVATFPLVDVTTRTGTLKEIKYPMAGMASEQISLKVYDLASGQTMHVNVDDFGRELYLTNITWSPASDIIYIQVVNREQNHIRLNKYNAKTGEFIKTLLEEKNPQYVEPQDKLVFLEGTPTHFIYRTDNRDGYRNLYICDTEGKTIRRLTKVNADVALVAQDKKYIYYTSAEVSPIEQHLFKVEINSGKITRLTQEAGWHQVQVSKDGKYIIDNYSNLNVPRVIQVVNGEGKTVKEILKADNPLKDYKPVEISIGTVKSGDGKYDNYYRLLKPADFNPEQKYPVIVYVYGGPHSQMVRNTWRADMRYWEMYMAQQGYVVYVMDNRGTSNRGAAFEKAIHRQCGRMEMEDQMMGVAFLRSQPWVDASRIGVHGWSYGGFMTISLITNYPDVFNVAVAGGPVIDWKWYEVMYGERYMDSPQRNPEGYQKVSLINKAKDLKGKLLICQGTMDNTVLWQHSLNFVQECIKHQVQVDYFPYPVAEHNVFGRDRIHLMQKVTDYFDDYLKPLNKGNL